MNEMNNKRADWAETALEAFSAECGPPRWPIEKQPHECMADLICDIGHAARRRGLDPMGVFKHAIAMFSAEDRAPDGQPYSNDLVIIKIEKAKART